MAFLTVLSFLSDLAENNTKTWFDAHRSDYEASRVELTRFTQNLLDKLVIHAPDIQGIEPKDCLFRMNRDVRFSKDKSPYKINMSVYIAPGGKKSFKAGYYLHIQPNASFLAGGIWMPEPSRLHAIRQEIDYHLQDFVEIIREPKLVNTGLALDNQMSLAGAPKGYDKENPALPYIKLKSFILSKNLDIHQIHDEEIVDYVYKHFEAMIPFCQFLNTAIDSEH